MRRIARHAIHALTALSVLLVTSLLYATPHVDAVVIAGGILLFGLAVCVVLDGNENERQKRR